MTRGGRRAPRGRWHDAVDRCAAVAAVLALHLLALGWLAMRPTPPDAPSTADAALQVVFVDRTPALPARSPAPDRAATPSPALSAPVRSLQAMRVPAPEPRRVPATDDTPLSAPAGDAVAPTGSGAWPGAPTGATATAPRFTRDPLGAPPVDLVAVPPPVRLRMRPPPSLQRTVGQVAAFLAPAGYEADPCPRIGRHLASLSSDGSDAGREALAEELRRRAHLCD